MMMMIIMMMKMMTIIIVMQVRHPRPRGGLHAAGARPLHGVHNPRDLLLLRSHKQDVLVTGISRYLVIYNIYSVGAQIRSQTEFLAKLLDLPPDSRTVATLSGGQQRRVSLAVSGVMDIISTYNI